jgi:Ca2+-binding EF-hand superfamily protein
MLYKVCSRFGMAPGAAFTDLSYSLGTWSQPQRSKEGSWLVPHKGILSMTFRIGWAGIGIPDDSEDPSFGCVLKCHFEKVRLQPSVRKTVSLLAHWYLITEKEERDEPIMMLDAMSMDFALAYPDLQALCNMAPELITEILCRLVPCALGGQTARYLCMMRAENLGEFVKMRSEMSNFFGLNIENPSWRYNLDLARMSDHWVAEQLMLLDRWEADISLKQQRTDSSQWGDRCHIRNATHGGRELPFGHVAEWHLPVQGLFTFDYSSGRRPPAHAQSLDGDTFASLLEALQTSGVDPVKQVEVLKAVASHIYLTCLQLRELLGIFPRPERQRIETVVLFYFRLVDVHNEKCIRARFRKEEELKALRDRLGYLIFFPFIQPEHSEFEFDLACHDQRVAACLVINIASKEQFHNLRDPSLRYPDGRLDNFTVGIPRGWVALDQMPRLGIFRVTYLCSPKFRSFSFRRLSLEKYGDFVCNIADSDVSWWSCLKDAPPDVNEFMEYLVGNFKNVHTAFDKLDGRGGNGKISLRKLSEGLTALKCKKFRRKEREERLATIFRYLDTSNEGVITLKEWEVLEQLWNDIIVSLREFVRFLGRVVGHEIDGLLDRAWSLLDVDGSGDISESEWHDVVNMRLSFFGPTMTIFGFLDKDDEGKVSLEEFRALDQFVGCELIDFVNFLEYKFSKGPLMLEKAWKALDMDGSGEIDLKEWSTVLKTKLGYYHGSSKDIFLQLGVDEDKAISWKEFSSLQGLIRIPE